MQLNTKCRTNHFSHIVMYNTIYNCSAIDCVHTGATILYQLMSMIIIHIHIFTPPVGNAVDVVVMCHSFVVPVGNMDISVSPD